MRVSVHYWGQLKHAAGRAAEEVQLTGACSASDFVKRLAHDHGEPLSSHLLDGTGEVRRNLLLVVGDEQVQAGTGVDLKDGDEVTILPPISGG